MSDIILTRHGKKRGKERMGLSQVAMKKIASKAYDEGMTPEETKGKIKKYMERLKQLNPTSNKIRIYSSYVFIFADEMLLTVFLIPPEFKDYIFYKKKTTTQ